MHNYDPVEGITSNTSLHKDNHDNNVNNDDNNNNYNNNHNYNKIVKSDWLSTALISALIGQFNRTVRVMPK